MGRAKKRKLSTRWPFHSCEARDGDHSGTGARGFGRHDASRRFFFFFCKLHEVQREKLQNRRRVGEKEKVERNGDKKGKVSLRVTGWR